MKYADYQQQAEEFRDLLVAQAAKPRDTQEWPDIVAGEWMGVDTTVVCRTPGCPVEGREDQARLLEQADGVYRVTCFQCGHTPEATAVFDDGPVVLLEASGNVMQISALSPHDGDGEEFTPDGPLRVSP